MNLHFLADAGPWPVVVLASALAAVAWWWYRRLLGPVAGAARWLPALRSGAIFLVAMMLAQPVLDHRTVHGTFARLDVVLDASASMAVADRDLPADRRLALAHTLGLLPADTRDPALVAAADALRTAGAAALAAAEGGDVAACVPTCEQAVAAVTALPEARRQALHPAAGGGALGSIAREVWRGAKGPSPDHPDVAAPADVSGTLPLCEAPGNWGQDYTQRLRGLVHPPVTGDYTFWLASDDDSRLWLGTDATAAGRREIARVSGWTPPRAWTQAPEQRSAPVHLEAGHAYWIEAVHHQGGGGDSLAVGWTLPGGIDERPIPGNRLSPVGGASAGDPLVAIARDLLDPARGLAQQPAAERRAALRRLAASAADWEHAVATLSAADAAQRIAADPVFAAACVRVDGMGRWQRLEQLLLRGPQPLLRVLAEHHDVDLLALHDGGTTRLWSARAGDLAAAGGLPASLGPAPEATATDLSHLTDVLGSDAGRPQQATAILAFSDGEHNAGAAPEEAARIAGGRGVAIHTVGLGDLAAAPDLAVAGIDAPTTVYAQDRLAGTVRLLDRMPPGRAFSLTVTCDGTVLQETALTTEGGGPREVALDAPLEDLVRQRLAHDAGRTWTSLPLTLVVAVTLLAGDREPGNNHRDLHLGAMVRRHRALVIDGRPRWEWRYLRAILGRDRRWQVDALVPGADGALPPGGLPADAGALDGYDVVVLGDVAPALLGGGMPAWLADFVAKRGGGLVLIDGRRGQLAGFAQGPLAPLLPVAWTGDTAPRHPLALAPTAAGAALAPFRLLPEASANAALWANLRPPHWLAAVQALPGTETLLEARLEGAAAPAPAAVLRRFGAGRVLYLAGDEAWRMRFHVADRFQEAWWNQLALWIMEEPFAVADQRVSLDAGGPVLAAGSPARIRARLRGPDGRPLPGTGARALILSHGAAIAELPLAADGAGGVLRATSAPLPAGTYEVRVSASGDPHAADALAAPVLVAAPDAGELVDLRLAEARLAGLAAASGGTYHREEEAASLPAVLAPLSDGTVVETRTVLWQGWWWFVPISILLGLEWAIRRKAGIL